MTTIWLGEGADAVEVEDGATVPLRGGERGSIHRYEGFITLRFKVNGFWGHASVISSDGSLVGSWMPHEYFIDIPALRRERAPKVETVGAWTNEVPKNQQAIPTWLCGTDCGPHFIDAIYWTHRPGNTPEKQAAFDAALNIFLDTTDTMPGAYGRFTNLREAALALGYGKR